MPYWTIRRRLRPARNLHRPVPKLQPLPSSPALYLWAPWWWPCPGEHCLLFSLALNMACRAARLSAARAMSCRSHGNLSGALHLAHQAVAATVAPEVAATVAARSSCRRIARCHPNSTSGESSGRARPARWISEKTCVLKTSGSLGFPTPRWNASRRFCRRSANPSWVSHKLMGRRGFYDGCSGGSHAPALVLKTRCQASSAIIKRRWLAAPPQRPCALSARPE